MIQNKKVQDLFPEGTKVTILLPGRKTYYVATIDFLDLVGVSTSSGMEIETESNTIVEEWEDGFVFIPYSAILAIQPVPDDGTYDAMMHNIYKPVSSSVSSMIGGSKNA